MNLLIIGCGSIGSRHARNLLSLGIRPDELVLCDNNSERLHAAGKALNITQLIDDMKNISDGYQPGFFDAILICVPNYLHVSIYDELKKFGRYFFIEKPIAHNLENIDIFSGQSNKIMVGYNHRFHKVMQQVKLLISEKRLGTVYFGIIEYGSYLPNWHPGSDYSMEYSASRAMGGGIILDDTHEIDLALHFFDEPVEVSGYCKKISDLKIDCEDTAEIIIKFKSGIYCTIHMDYLQRLPVRRGKIVCERGVIEYDENANEVKIFDGDLDKWEVISYSSNTNDMYLDEMKYFLDKVKSDSDIELNADVGIRSLEIAYKILKDNKML